MDVSGEAQSSDSTWVQQVPGVSTRRYNKAWRRAVKRLAGIKASPAPFRIYAITNRQTGESYVGATRRSLCTRWASHVYRAAEKDRTGQGSCLSLAIRKYGEGAFWIRTLSEALNEEVAYKLEKFWIRELRTLTPHGYNMTGGGKIGFRWSRKIRVKIRNSQIARMAKPGVREHLRNARTRLERQRAERRGRRLRQWKAQVASRTITTAFP